VVGEFVAELFFDIETTGLLSEITTARITCIGLIHSDLGVRIWSSRDEIKLLTDFFHFVSREVSVEDVWVSFNGIGFDVPFICSRASRLGLVIPKPFLANAAETEFKLAKHVDLMLVVYPHFARLVKPTSTGRITKDSARNFFNIYEPKVGSAIHCLLVAEDSNWAEIWQHNAADLFSTKKIYKECVTRGWV